MKRSWYVLLSLALLAPACKTAGPKAPPAPPEPLPDLLRPYQDALRVLPHQGDARAVTLKTGQRLTGACDVAVRVRSVAFDKGAARLALETAGQPKVGDRAVTCKRTEPMIQLTLTGFPPGPVTPEVTARIDEVLLTPEAYLRTKDIVFDRPPGDPPTEVASQLTDADEGERRLARGVLAWPRMLLSVDAAYRAPKGRARYERLVDFEAVVGADGRLHRPQVKTSLDAASESAVLGALPFWRLEPARRAKGPAAVRVALRLVLRVY
jgi:hypothetical protein